jgi:hypothetical protein
MRPDMSKVIVERPRLRGGRGKKHRALVADLDAPLHQGMRRVHKNLKCLNENLNPLQRFLGSRVGKYWPKVYAEICENLRPSSTIQQHVRDHLFDFVATRTTLRTDGVWVNNGYGGPARLEDSGCDFYVHPVSKCLMRNKHRQGWTKQRQERSAQRAAEIAERRRDLGENRQLHKLNGCWFEVALAPLATRRQTLAKPHAGSTRLVTGLLPDVIIDAGLSSLHPAELYGRSDVFATGKRQLGRRELAAHGLKND